MNNNQAFEAGFKACLSGTARSDAPAGIVGDLLIAWRRGWDYCNRGTI